MEFLESAARYLWSVVLVTATQLLVLLGPALCLAFLIHLLAGTVRSSTTLLIGERAYLGLFGWLGTTIHEGSHALFCWIFRHRIEEVRFFKPDKSSGSLGYVKHSWEKRSTYQVAGNFFIGIAPIPVGAALIYLAGWLLLGRGVIEPVGDLGQAVASPDPLQALESIATGLADQARDLLERLFSSRSVERWQLWVFLYLAFAMGSSMRLSPEDLKGTRLGAFVLVMALLIFNGLTLWIGNFGEEAARSVSATLGLFYAVLLLAVFLNALAALVLATLRLPGWLAQKLR
jgi:hypothetical protein